MPYIDKTIVVEIIRNKWCASCTGMRHSELDDFECKVAATIDAIKDLPDADVEPVKKGKWVPMNHGYRCTACGKSNWEATPYCPKCGASVEVDNEGF